jgi:hypothetical protein
MNLSQVHKHRLEIPVMIVHHFVLFFVMAEARNERRLSGYVSLTYKLYLAFVSIGIANLSIRKSPCSINHERHSNLQVSLSTHITIGLKRVSIYLMQKVQINNSDQHPLETMSSNPDTYFGAMVLLSW